MVSRLPRAPRRTFIGPTSTRAKKDLPGKDVKGGLSQLEERMATKKKDLPATKDVKGGLKRK